MTQGKEDLILVVITIWIYVYCEKFIQDRAILQYMRITHP